MRLLLYTKPGCHLCEEAREIVRDVMGGGSVLEEVDISRDQALEQRYGTRIPVLRRAADGVEIGWPFGPADVITLLDAEPPASR